MPYRAVAEAALARWRDAEQRKSLVEQSTEEWRQAEDDAQAAKADYEQAIEDARREHLPEPPPFGRAIDAEA